ncbi:MAG: hypothetical protein ACP5MD_10310 [Verrucomicrobiia bacterium]
MKNAFYVRAGQMEYERELLDRILPAEDRKPIDLPSARKLVEGAVAYAKDLGFAPNPDYKKACRVFGGIKAADSTASFTYGKDGKPFYITGPYDPPQLAFRIVEQLRSRCGEGGFHCLICVGGGELDESDSPDTENP